ncbi:MAG TPA: hypothetical protein V6C81_13070 [Planktothrix sp.]|jgi:hypothetical protein
MSLLKIATPVIHCALLALSLTVICCRRAAAQSTDLMEDWQVNIALQTYSPYLDHQGSPVSKLIKATVSYAQPAKAQAASYEDLYYTTSHVLGVRRVSTLDVTPGVGGVIRVMNSDSDQNYAAANAIGRVFLDLFLQKCTTKEVVVPRNSFSGIVNAMCNQGFRMAPPVPERKAQGTEAAFILTVVSDPPGDLQEVLR